MPQVRQNLETPSGIGLPDVLHLSQRRRAAKRVATFSPAAESARRTGCGQRSISSAVESVAVLGNFCLVVMAAGQPDHIPSSSPTPPHS